MDNNKFFSHPNFIVPLPIRRKFRLLIENNETERFILFIVDFIFAFMQNGFSANQSWRKAVFFTRW